MAECAVSPPPPPGPPPPPPPPPGPPDFNYEVSRFVPFATVISQYANSPIILQLVENFGAYFDPTANMNAFFNLVWNVDTAQGYGLDVWGRIVGVDRVLHVSVGGFLGWEEATDAETFGTGVFYAGADSTSNFALSDSAYRRLILAKALANITDGSIPSINQILIDLFPDYANQYVTDGGDMTMTYTFTGTLSPVDLAIIGNSGVLPKPVGVSVTVVQI